MAEKRLLGLPAAGGTAAGPVFHFVRERLEVERQSVEDVGHERQRLERALAETETELEGLRIHTAETIGEEEATIFDAQLLVLQDPELRARVETLLVEEGVNAGYAWQEATNHYVKMLGNLGDAYLAERANDIEDVAQRVLASLLARQTRRGQLTEAAIVIAPELTPSDTVTLPKEYVLGFCTAGGGPTSHVAILAKALGVPAVVGLGDDWQQLRGATRVIVDGDTGTVIVDPAAELVETYARRREVRAAAWEKALAAATGPAITRDGKTIPILANLASAEGVDEALRYGAEGIGLLRTEFLFLRRQEPPDEEEQVAIYTAILEGMGGRPVIVRTLDIGGDKPAPYLDLPPEDNPFLGLRGTRLMLKHPALFQTQLRALLRAGAGHSLKIMFPMIGTVEEVRQARAEMEKARESLRERDLPTATDAEVGIMIEVPAAAIAADLLAPHVDFFSIGTNDLTQYTAAADRTNPEVAYRADPFAPAILRLLKMTIDAAHRHGRWAGLCGEMAGNPLAAPLLLGLGLDEFSMTPRAIPEIKATLRRFSLDEARAIARQALSLDTAAAVRNALDDATVNNAAHD